MFSERDLDTVLYGYVRQSVAANAPAGIDDVIVGHALTGLRMAQLSYVAYSNLTKSNRNQSALEFLRFAILSQTVAVVVPRLHYSTGPKSQSGCRHGSNPGRSGIAQQCSASSR